MQLDDGRILLSYGDRRGGTKGVVGRLSEDDGQTWGRPFRIADVEVVADEIGYPSSVQRQDGKIVTAFYSDLDGFHMGAVVWELPGTKEPKESGQLTHTDVFVSGTEGYGIYRIPAITVTNKGTVLAFAEGRASIHDTSKNDIVQKRLVVPICDA